MKKILNLLSGVILLLVIISSCNCGKNPSLIYKTCWDGSKIPADQSCPPEPPAKDTQAPTVPGGLTGSASTTAVTLTWPSSTDNVAVKGYKVFRSGVQIADVSVTTYTDNGLTEKTQYSYTVLAYDAAGNSSAQTSPFIITTPSAYTATINAATSYDASTTATDKSLVGRGVAKGVVIDVATAGTVKVEVIGQLTNNNPAVSHIWINGADNADFAVATSTLNSKVPKAGITSQSFVLTLQPGINSFCFKAAALNGMIANGTKIGIKITGDGWTMETASYTANSAVADNDDVQKVYFNATGNPLLIPGLNQTYPMGWIGIKPSSGIYQKLSMLAFSTGAYPYSTNKLVFSNFGYIANNVWASQKGTETTVNGETVIYSPTTPYQTAKDVNTSYAGAKIDIKADVKNDASTNWTAPAIGMVPIPGTRFVGNPEIEVWDNGVNPAVRVQ